MEPGTPQANFAAFVRRAVDTARAERGVTINGLAKGHVGRSTVFRWLAGDWQQFPELDTIRRFCAATGASYEKAVAALGGNRSGRAAAGPSVPRRLPVVPVGVCPLPSPCPHCAAGRPAAPAGLQVRDGEGVALLGLRERRALPPAFHGPVWRRVRGVWACRACPAQPWPCLVARAHGELVRVG